MAEEQYNVMSPAYLKEIKDSEKKMVKFLTHYLFKAIGTNKTLFLVSGINYDSFGKAIASLAGYIKKNRMDIKIMTILALQEFSCKIVNDKRSFAQNLINQSVNFNKHEDGILNLKNTAFNDS